jgi:hypothetical protein
MSTLIQFTTTVGCIGLLVVGTCYLRRTQPDPNPAIEAREAAKLAARMASPQAAHGTGGAAGVTLEAVPAASDRRSQSLPHIGTERRQQMASEAQAWRNAS